MSSSQPPPIGFVFSTPAKEKPPDGGGDKVMIDKNIKVSFRDKLMGQQQVVQQRQRVDLIGEKLARIEYKDNNPLEPMVHIDERVFEGLCEPWKEALVVKLLGKSIGFITMKDRLRRIWKLATDFDLMDIGHGFYMVELDQDVDRTKVINEGPWMIFDHYLTVQCWSQDFIAPTAKIDRTMVWIRFPGLNLYYYDESILLA